MSFPEPSDGTPPLCGSERLPGEALRRHRPRPPSGIDFDAVQSCFAVALHMHQPLIPADGAELQRARVISNLQCMAASGDSGSRYNASVFASCYQRMGEIIPQLVQQGHRPRIMLEYSGCLLHGLKQMGLEEIFASLRRITCEQPYASCVEWLGAPWGHAVAPSTPVQDYRLHVQAWQQHFAALFGLEALARIRGFSPSEMALPNHPDVCYEFVKTLLECGYQWVLVQEHTVERQEDGSPVQRPHLPHRLVATNSHGQSLSIIAILKTQGSDTKLVGQMQPYYEAKGLSRQMLAGRAIPPLVTQISDGENGGVMMNEFPSKYQQVMAEASGGSTPPVNVGEYLDYLEAIGIGIADLPTIQPLWQRRIWERLAPGSGPEKLAQVLEKLRKEDARFHVEGGSWTNNISWVRGYEDLLGPMESASALFAQKALAPGISTSEPRYCRALYHLLMSQTSCYRYWGQGLWTEYGRELCRRTIEILQQEF